jgi:O-antigen ligase
MTRDDRPQADLPAFPWPPPQVQAPVRRVRRVQDWLAHPLFWIVVAAAIGAFLGSQATGLAQRYAKLIVGLAFMFIIFRYPTYIGVGVFMIVYPFRTTIQIGNTNLIFTILLAVTWVIRARLGSELRWQRTYLDWAILAYLAAHLLSFVNVTTREQLFKSYLFASHLAVPVLFYYTVVHVARSSKKLLLLSRVFTVSVAINYITAFLQRFAPGVKILPAWYVTGMGTRQFFGEDAVQRIGGVLTDPLMSDLAAIACVHQIYMALRSKDQPLWRLAHWLLAATSVYVVSLTGNRGGLVALGVGLLYFFWIYSAELSWKRVGAALVVLLAVLTLGEKTLGRFEGNVTLLTRMAGTYVERGVPDTRRGAWAYAWGLIKQSPILGHGPYFSHEETYPGMKPIWPHNAFLFYLFTIGIVGLPTYLILLWRVLKRTWVGRGLRVGEVSLARGLTAVWHIAILQFIIGQMRTDHQRGDVYIYLMWILFSFGILARQIWEDEKRQPALAADQPGAH